jgi:hypothetical protein
VRLSRSIAKEVRSSRTSLTTSARGGPSNTLSQAHTTCSQTA